MAGELNDEQKRYLGNILHSSTHLLRVIAELLDLARLESGKVALEPRVFRLDEVLTQIEAMMSPMMFKKGQTLRFTLPINLPALHTDPEKVLQILLNLVSNAHKYTPVGGHISVSAERRGAQVRVAVIDDGVGIPPEDLPRLFEEFTPVAKKGKPNPKGTGLGLAITKRLVEAMGGTLSVESTYGRGSTFAFTLQAAEPEGA
jgi:signal transduction histidine kinase